MTTANDGSGNNANRDVWETPSELFNTLNSQYNFTFDCCANMKNRKTLSFANLNGITLSVVDKGE